MIWLQKTLSGNPQILLDEPLDDPEAEVAVDLALDADQLALLAQMKTGPWDPNLVEEVGRALCELLKKQPAIGRDFATRLALDGPVAAPIYLRVDPPDVDEWPWEALSDKNAGFLALERRWPIARVKRVKAPVIKSEYLFAPPLRILAVLGAAAKDPLARISAKEEWDALYTAVKKSSLNVDLHVYVCEEDLKTQIQDLKEPWITVGFLEEDRALFDRIKDFKPQLLHFFCHGVADTPPFLQIGTRLDWRTKENGSINIEASQLRDRADPDQNVWLITLNCCEGAAQPAESANGSRSRSMASSLGTGRLSGGGGHAPARGQSTRELLLRPVVRGAAGRTADRLFECRTGAVSLGDWIVCGATGHLHVCREGASHSGCAPPHRVDDTGHLHAPAAVYDPPRPRH